MKIGRLSSETGLSIHTLRYYEKLGLIHKTSKDKSGHRDYKTQDIELVNWITCLKKSGLPLEKIKVYAQAFEVNNIAAMSEILEVHLSQLAAQQQELQHHISITHYKLEQLKRLT